MAVEGEFPKVDGDILFASEVNSLGIGMNAFTFTDNSGADIINGSVWYSAKLSLENDVTTGRIKAAKRGTPIYGVQGAYYVLSGDTVNVADDQDVDLVSGTIPDVTATNNIGGFDSCRRLPAYQLYHVLNHLNLFGGGYLGQANSLLKQLECTI